MLKKITSAAAVIAAILLVAPTAQADPAPPGYRSDEVLDSVLTATDLVVPIRRGWYDTDNGVGFGFNKASQRHNIRDLAAIRYVLESPIVVPKSDAAKPGFNYTAYAKLRDNETGEVVAEVKVIAADTTGDFPVYHGSPGGNPLGLQTVYCEGFDLLCLNWVSPALAGQTGAPPARSAPADTAATRSYDPQS